MGKKKSNDNKIMDLIEKEESKADIEIRRKDFEKNIQNIWGHSTLGLEAKKAAMAMLSTKTGMYARIPIVCKAENCPYQGSCSLLSYNLAPEGERCPIETAQIELRFLEYQDEFELDMSSFTDKNLVSEIINLDIIAERCKALLSKETNPIIEVTSGITEDGMEYSHPEISKAYDLYERTISKREGLYNLMLATRKDKKGNTGKDKTLLEIIEDASKNGFVIDEKPKDFIDIEDKKRL